MYRLFTLFNNFDHVPESTNVQQARHHDQACINKEY